MATVGGIGPGELSQGEVVDAAAPALELVPEVIGKLLAGSDPGSII